MGKARKSKSHRFRSDGVGKPQAVSSNQPNKQTTPDNFSDADLVIKDSCHQCPDDSAGVPYKDGRCQCMCTHFVDEPLLKGKSCRRKTVAVESNPRSPGIPVDVMVDERNGTTSFGAHASLSSNVINPSLQINLILALMVVTFVMLVLAVLCLLRKRFLRCLARFNKTKLKMKTASTSNRLLPEHLITNPTYESTCLDLCIRIYPADEVTLLTQVGQGCFGKVFKGTLNDGEVVAVKMVRSEYATEVRREIETMSSFTHPNILPLLGIAKSPEADSPWLLFEFMEHGDLASVLRRNPFRSPRTFTPAPTLLPQNSSHSASECPDNAEQEKENNQQFQLSPNLLTNVAMQIAEGMKYLASQHFVHRDLAARNCLVSATGVIKISDFGLSRDVYTCDYYKIGGSKLLPIRWMAPESILYGCFTLESDVWAYGTVLWEIYTWGKQPHYGHSNEEAMQLIVDGVLLSPPSDCPTLIQEIMAGCWKTEAKHRLTFPQICDKFTKAGLTTVVLNNNDNESLNQVKVATDESGYEIPRVFVRNEVDYFQVV